MPFLFQFNYAAFPTFLATNAEMFVRADNINNVDFFPSAEWNFKNDTISLICQSMKYIQKQ